MSDNTLSDAWLALVMDLVRHADRSASDEASMWRSWGPSPVADESVAGEPAAGESAPFSVFLKSCKTY